MALAKNIELIDACNYLDKLYVQKRIDKEKVDHARDSVLLEKHIMANISSPFLPRLCSSR